MGEAWPEKGATIGYVPQEPRPDARQDRPRERRGGGRAHPRASEEAGGDRREDGRPGRGLRQALRRDGDGADADRRDQRLRTSTARSRWRWTRCGCRRRTRRSSSSPAANAAASPSARRSCRATTCCCSTNRPTTSTPRASSGSNTTSADYPGTVVAVTHDRYFLDNVAKWILELDRGRGYPYRGQLLRLARAEEDAGSRSRRSRRPPGRRRSTANSNGRRWRRAPASPRARPASPPSTSCRHR